MVINEIDNNAVEPILLWKRLKEIFIVVLVRELFNLITLLRGFIIPPAMQEVGDHDSYKKFLLAVVLPFRFVILEISFYIPLASDRYV